MPTAEPSKRGAAWDSGSELADVVARAGGAVARSLPASSTSRRLRRHPSATVAATKPDAAPTPPPRPPRAPEPSLAAAVGSSRAAWIYCAQPRRPRCARAEAGDPKHATNRRKSPRKTAEKPEASAETPATRRPSTRAPPSPSCPPRRATTQSCKTPDGPTGRRARCRFTFMPSGRATNNSVPATRGTRCRRRVAAVRSTKVRLSRVSRAVSKSFSVPSLFSSGHGTESCSLRAARASRGLVPPCPARASARHVARLTAAAVLGCCSS